MNLYLLFGAIIIGLILSIIAPSFNDIILFARIYGRTLSIRISFKALGNYINTAVAFISLIIAIQAYNDSKESGPQQQATLEKTKVAIDSSTLALRGVLRISEGQQEIMSQNLEIGKEMLDAMDRQWLEQQNRLAQRPKFDVRCKFEFFSPQPVGNSIIDSRFHLPMSDSVTVIGDNEGYYESNKNSPFYEAYNDYYKLVGEGSPNGYILRSKIFSQRQLENKIIPIQITTTREENDTRFFYVALLIRNVGNLNSDNPFVTVTSLRRGLSLSGEGINAPELMKTIDGNLSYSTGTKQIPSLTIYQSTNEQVALTLKVNFRKGLIGKEMPIRIGIYDRYTKNTPLIIRFRIVPN